MSNSRILISNVLYIKEMLYRNIPNFYKKRNWILIRIHWKVGLNPSHVFILLYIDWRHVTQCLVAGAEASYSTQNLCFLHNFKPIFFIWNHNLLHFNELKQIQNYSFVLNVQKKSEFYIRNITEKCNILEYLVKNFTKS